MERPPSEGAPNEKEIAWQEELKRLERVGDRLGYRIDPGIKETVAALVLNRFPTYGSCEGHLEERRGKMRKLRPYVAVGHPAPPERFVGEAEIRRKIAGQYNIAVDEIHENDAAGRAYWDYIQEHKPEETEQYKEIRRKNEALKDAFAKILAEFHEKGSQPSEKPLAIRDIGPAGHFRIEDAKKNPKNEIADDQIDLSREELAKERAEMDALSEFLR